MLGEATYVGFIPVTDIARARAFYASVLGLAVVEESPFALVLDAHGTMLRLTPVPDLAVQPFTIAGWGVADIRGEIDELAAKGVSFHRYDGMAQDERGVWASPSGALVAWFSDPDRNTLSVTQFA